MSALPDRVIDALKDNGRLILPAVQQLMAEAWDEAYSFGVEDERTSQANPGIAGCFCNSTPCRCVIAPARANPYRSL